MIPEQLVNKWIKELHEAGLSFDQMIEVFKMARIKYKLILEENEKN